MTLLMKRYIKFYSKDGLLFSIKNPYKYYNFYYTVISPTFSREKRYYNQLINPMYHRIQGNFARNIDDLTVYLSRNSI